MGALALSSVDELSPTSRSCVLGGEEAKQAASAETQSPSMKGNGENEMGGRVMGG